MRMTVSVLVVIVYVGLLALVFWLLMVRPSLPTKDGISSLFQLVAMYTFIVGFLSALGVFTTFGSLQRELTSPDPLLFLRANLNMFVVIFSAIGVGLDSTNFSLRSVLTLPLLLAIELVVFAYAVIHFFVVAPLAYFAYLVTSVPVDAILNAPSSVEISIGDDRIDIKGLVQKNEAAVRNFAVGVPSFVLSLLLKIWPLLTR